MFLSCSNYGHNGIIDVFYHKQAILNSISTLCLPHVYDSRKGVKYRHMGVRKPNLDVKNWDCTSGTLGNQIWMSRTGTAHQELNPDVGNQNRMWET
jgi:hypothetical protein